MFTREEFDQLDDSLASFELIKKRSEEYWRVIDFEPNGWGPQIQRHSIWEKGLNEAEINQFETEIGHPFPESLRNYFRTMNGLNPPQINVHGGEEEPTYEHYIYRFRESTAEIKDFIEWTAEKNGHTMAQLKSGEIPFVFPYMGNRFLVFDDSGQALSIYGDDIIYWGLNLSQGLVKDLFYLFMDTTKADLEKYTKVKGWPANYR